MVIDAVIARCHPGGAVGKDRRGLMKVSAIRETVLELPLNLAILHQRGPAVQCNNSDHRFLSVRIAEVQIFPEGKENRRLLSAVDCHVVGVETCTSMSVQDRIEPTLQDGHISPSFWENDRAAIGQFGQFDIERFICRFTVECQVCGEPVGSDENCHWKLSRMQNKYCVAKFVCDCSHPRLVGEQCDCIGSGDRLDSGLGGDNAACCLPIELVQFTPGDQAVDSPALRTVATVNNDNWETIG